MVNYEKKEVVSYDSVISSYECDCCGKKVEASNRPDSWYGITSGHQSWGSDSVDSIDRIDSCSIECLSKQLKEEEKRVCSYEDSYIEIADLNAENVKALIERLEVKKKV